MTLEYFWYFRCYSPQAKLNSNNDNLNIFSKNLDRGREDNFHLCWNNRTLDWNTHSVGVALFWWHDYAKYSFSHFSALLSWWNVWATVLRIWFERDFLDYYWYFRCYSPYPKRSSHKEIFSTFRSTWIIGKSTTCTERWKISLDLNTHSVGVTRWIWKSDLSKINEKENLQISPQRKFCNGFVKIVQSSLQKVGNQPKPVGKAPPLFLRMIPTKCNV